jgi:Fur family transcriptional regulator, ferric uptake regulator
LKFFAPSFVLFIAGHFFAEDGFGASSIRTRMPIMSTDHYHLLRNCGLRVTSARLKILQQLQNANAESKHLSAEDIYRKTIQSDKKITLGTIYRVLGELEQRGLVLRRHWQQGSSAAYFEFAQPQHHDHLVCMESGVITEFNDVALVSCLQQLSRERNMELVDYNLVVYIRPRSA